MKFTSLIKAATAVVGSALINQAVIADTFHLSLSDEAFGVGAEFESVGENSSADINWLHDEDYDLLRAGYYVNFMPAGSDIALDKIALKFGVKAMLLESDFDDGLAIPLGLKAELPVAEKLAVFADVFYASGKLSFNDVEDYFEWSAGVTAKVLQNGQISVGYRLIEVETDDYKDVELEDGVFAKIAFGF